MVNEYSNLRITRDTDRLIALTGIAKVFQDRLKSHYLAGIWLSDLARGLLWELAKPLSFEKGYNQDVYRLSPESKFAPSWSWAFLVSVGQNTPIQFLVMYQESSKKHRSFAYVRTNIPRMAVDSLKNMESKYLIVRGLTITAELLHYYHKRNDTLHDTTLEISQGNQKHHLGLALDHTLSLSTVEDGEKVYCLLVGTSIKERGRFGLRTYWLHILVCKLCRSTSAYERLGVCLTESDSKVFKGAQKSIMKLV